MPRALALYGYTRRSTGANFVKTTPNDTKVVWVSRMIIFYARNKVQVVKNENYPLRFNFNIPPVYPTVE